MTALLYWLLSTVDSIMNKISVNSVNSVRFCNWDMFKVCVFCKMKVQNRGNREEFSLRKQSAAGRHRGEALNYSCSFWGWFPWLLKRMLQLFLVYASRKVLSLLGTKLFCQLKKKIVSFWHWTMEILLLVWDIKLCQMLNQTIKWDNTFAAPKGI